VRSGVFASADEGVFVSLDQEDLADAVQRAFSFKKRDHKDWQTQFKRGLSNSDRDDFKVERYGCIGEQAFHILTGLPIDRKVRRFGNRFDFAASGVKCKIEVKIAMRYPEYEIGKFRPKEFDGRIFGYDFFCDKFYLKAKDDKRTSKSFLPLNADVYVFSVAEFLAPNDLNPIEGSVQFIGWILQGKLDKFKEVGPGVKSGSVHLNYYIHRKYLSSMTTFLQKFRKGFNESSCGLFI